MKAVFKNSFDMPINRPINRTKNGVTDKITAYRPSLSLEPIFRSNSQSLADLARISPLIGYLSSIYRF